MDVNCTVYLRADSNPPNPEELKRQLTVGNLEEKAACLKTLVRCIINDETYPRLIMHIITTIIPVIHESNELRKIMLLYWEVVEKNKSATDDTLKD
jgi:vesicle coat complex subunit